MSQSLTTVSFRMPFMLLAFFHMLGTWANECRCFPGDSCWPPPASWASLNSSVGGRLIATIPLGSPCHDPNYNAAVCESLRENWFYPPEQFARNFPILFHLLNGIVTTLRPRRWRRSTRVARLSRPYPHPVC